MEDKLGKLQWLQMFNFKQVSCEWNVGVSKHANGFESFTGIIGVTKKQSKVLVSFNDELGDIDERNLMVSIVVFVSASKSLEFENFT